MIITIVLQCLIRARHYHYYCFAMLNKIQTSLQEGLVLWSLVSLKCARDSVTVFHLQIIYKFKLMKLYLACQLTCVYVYWTMATQTSGVMESKSLTFIKDYKTMCFSERFSYTWQEIQLLFWDDGQMDCIIIAFWHYKSMWFFLL